MQVRIEEERVEQNVLFFVQLLSLLELETEGEKNALMRKIPAFLHRASGEIVFAKLLPNPQSIKNSEWVEIDLYCVFDPRKKEVVFDIEEGKREDLAPLALRILRETIETLNHLSHLAERAESVQQGLLELTQLQFQRLSDRLSFSRLQRSWDRWEAEEQLMQHPYHSFLIRKDEFAKILEEQLQDIHGRKISCYTLTFSLPTKRICDRTIVHDQEEWLFYNDDLSLEGRRYSSSALLLESMGSVCRYGLIKE